MTENAVKIELSEAESGLFLLFREHQDNFATIVKSGTFLTRSGSVTLHFDYQGRIKVIKRDDVIFRA